MNKNPISLPDLYYVKRTSIVDYSQTSDYRLRFKMLCNLCASQEFILLSINGFVQVIAEATVVIAIFAYVSYRLASNIQTRDEDYRQQITDLYQAMVISYLTHGTETGSSSRKMEYKISKFKEHYTGKTTIFD